MKVTHTDQHKGDVFSRTRTSLCVLSALGLLTHASATLAQEAEPQTTEDEETVEVIQVSGMRSSIITATEAKMSSDKIMDGISALDIGALPDRSVTETLQRVPGVAIDRYMTQGDPEHFSVEGNGVIVRGLTQVRSELNGRSTFSANGGRTLSFGDVPPELLSAVNVYKSPSADQIEGGIGGTIDLETRLPFQDDQQRVAVTLTANYGDLIEETKPAFSALYSNTWDTSAGKMGLLLDIAQSELSTRNDSMYVRPFFYRDDIEGHEGETVYVPRGADWRTMYFNRKRSGGYAALQWEPKENHELTFTYFVSDYDMTWNEDAIFVGNDPFAVQATTDSVFGDDNVLEYGRLYQDGGIPMGSDVRVSDQTAKTEDFALRYRWYNDTWAVESSLQRVNSSSKGLDSTVATEILVPYIDVDFRGSLPKVNSDETYLATPENYNWNFQMDNQYDREATMTAFDLDVTYYTGMELLSAVRFGGRYSDSRADNSDTGYNWSALAVSWLQGGIVEGQENITPDASDLNLNTFDNFFGGRVPSPANVYAPIVSYARDYPQSYETLQNKFVYADWASWAYWSQRNLEDDQWQNDQSEKTTALYAMVDYDYIDGKFPISGNLGVRYVHTKNVAHGHLQYPFVSDFGNGAYEDLDAEHSYSKLLPSFNLKMELDEGLLLRFAASKAMARPDFNSMGANLTFSASVKESSQGKQEAGEPLGPDDYDLTLSADSNPYLDPMTSTQFDLSLEWYYDDANSMYAALFTKDIKGYQVYSLSQVEYGGYTYNATWPVSTGKADITGAELTINHFFNNLPAPFDGLGIQANYTYIDSSTELGDDTRPYDTDGSTYGTMPYQGLSKQAFNLVGMYEKDNWSIRLAYNWRDEFLMSTRANGFQADDSSWALPLFNAPTGYLDGSIAYKINDNYTVVLEANNLADTVTRNIMKQNGPGNHYGAYHVNDVRYALSLRVNF